MAGYLKKFIAFDLETTDLDPERGRIMEVGAVEVGFIFDERTGTIKTEFGEVLETLVQPEMPVPPPVAELTGISSADLAVAPKWRDIKPRVEKFLSSGLTILGHNINFDLNFLRFQGVNASNPAVDSLVAAQTFCPLLPLHSLEYLSQVFGVKGLAAHRALADAKATALVTAAVINEFLRFPRPLQEKLRNHLRQFKTNFSDLFLDLPQIGEERRSAPVLAKSHRETDLLDSSSPILPDPVFAKWPDRTIASLPLGFGKYRELLQALARLSDFPGIVAVSHFLFLDDISFAQKVPSQFQSLCPVRLRALRESENYPAEALGVLMKLDIAQSLGKVEWDLSGLKFSFDEQKILKKIQVDPEVCPRHSCAFWQNLNERGAQPVRFLTLSQLFELVRRWPLTWKDDRLLMFDLGAVEDRFAESLTETYNLKKLREMLAVCFELEAKSVPPPVSEIANELDLFFGILHLVYRKSGIFSQNLVLGEKSGSALSVNFMNLIHPAEKLRLKLEKFLIFLGQETDLRTGEEELELSILREKMRVFSQFLRNFFSEEENGSRRWLKFNAEAVDLNFSPADIRKPWQEFCEKFKSVFLTDTALPSSTFSYFHRRLGLEDFAVRQIATPPRPQKIVVKLISKAQRAMEPQDLAEELRDEAIWIVPNEAQLKKIYEQLLAAGKPARGSLLAYKFSGNVSGIMNKLRQNKHYLLLITTYGLTRYFSRLPQASDLVISRVPFEAPEARPHLGVDAKSRNSFSEYFLPRALHMLHQIISRFLSAHAASEDKRRIFIMDERASEGYDGAFLKYFQEFPDFEVFVDNQAV